MKGFLWLARAHAQILQIEAAKHCMNTEITATPGSLQRNESKAQQKIVYLKEKESFGMDGDPDYKPHYSQSSSYLAFLLQEGWRITSVAAWTSGAYVVLEKTI